MQRTEMQNSMEFSAEMTRASLNAAIKIGHQTIEAYRQCVVLQADSTDQMLEESVKITKALLGEGDAREAITLWGKACERTLKRSFEASRGISETALKAQSEMIEAAGQLLTAVTDNAVATAKASSTAITRAAQHPTHHRKAA
jgi:phasin family protein